jgi:hypothetical protein
MKNRVSDGKFTRHPSRIFNSDQGSGHGVDISDRLPEESPKSAHNKAIPAILPSEEVRVAGIANVKSFS